jgi:predicted nucleic acid-binding protein
MTAVCIIDTSVFCNILGVPNKSQRQDEALDELHRFLEKSATLLLPMVTIYETGNHIAQSGDGRVRRQKALEFGAQVRQAISGQAPWTPTPLHDLDQLASWLNEFPGWAMQGAGFGDLAIRKVFEEQCELNPGRRVLIWTYDRHLQGYDRSASI